MNYSIFITSSLSCFLDFNGGGFEWTYAGIWQFYLNLELLNAEMLHADLLLVQLVLLYCLKNFIVIVQLEFYSF